jgi:hypothetical protein
MKYKGTCYPNWERYDVEVEANSKEQAKRIMETEANQSCSFGIDLEDIEEVEEE